MSSSSISVFTSVTSTSTSLEGSCGYYIKRYSCSDEMRTGFFVLQEPSIVTKKIFCQFGSNMHHVE